MSRFAVRCFVFGVACAALCFVTAASKAEESADGLWTFRTTNAAPSSGMQTWWTPTAYRSVEVDTADLDAALANAPVLAGNLDVRTDGVEISLPLPDGTFQRFAVVEKHLLETSARQANPGLITYCGVGLDDSEALVTCTRSVMGFQCMIRRPAGTVFIDPLFRGNEQIHSVYTFRASMQGQSFACMCEDAAATLAAPAAGGGGGFAGLVTSGATRHEFRLAVACTGEYFINTGGTVALATAAITTTVNNVTAVLENDLTVRMVLQAPVINQNPATDPYPRASLNAEVQADLDANVGDANYDIGHLFDSFGGSISGNAGCIGCICTSGSKGSAWSDGSSPNPTGGNMTFLVLHEMGHQLGGRHSWTGTTCAASQWDSNSSVEPGSGSTIMSYSSVCGASDEVLGPNTVGDLYYHADSVDRIVTVTAGAACRNDVATGNSPPSVSAGSDVTIPANTPFTLFASGSDPDSDPLTYCWEQMDVSPMTYPYNQVDTGDNPLFRSRPPVGIGVRWFPQVSDNLAGNFFPGTLGEQLPSTNRTMEFWVTARDNVPNGGGVDQDSMFVTVDASTGPFAVTFPNGGETLPVNVPLNITWNVAGTTGGGVNVANVQIQLWDSVLQSTSNTISLSTPNDGSFQWTPDCPLLGTNWRIRVVGLTGTNHTFFDFSDADFEIADITPPVVTCNLLRTVLWPPRNALLPLGFSWSQLPDDCDPAPTRTLSIYSTEADGLPPYSPDWTFAAPFDLKLRAQRAYPGPGRVYLVVVSSTDASGNRGRDCCTTIVPGYPSGMQILMLRATAMAAEAACLASPLDVAPAGFVPLVTGVALP